MDEEAERENAVMTGMTAEESAAYSLSTFIALLISPFLATALARGLYFVMKWWLAVLGMQETLDEQRVLHFGLAAMFACVVAISFMWLCFSVSQLIAKRLAAKP